jgi:tRNA threonylcarbamoyladenosine biosynthesis protein TsaB
MTQKILAIDTALDGASAAVWEGDGAPAAGSVSEVACPERAAASRDLLPAIDRLLATRGWSIADLDGVVLTIGPGSFTGLRIGVSLVKGLVSARRMRIAAVGTLDAIAVASGRSGPVAALLDAGRGEVYARLFQCESGGVEPLADETLATPEAWAASLPAHGALSCVGTGAIRHADVLQAGLGARATIVQGPVMTTVCAALLLGVRRFAGGQDTPMEALVPRYLRRSSAETNLASGVVGSRRRRMLGWDPAHGRA